MSLALIIDDDPINNMICERLLLHSKIVSEVKVFISPHEALEWLIQLPQGQHPSLMLLDINMPMMDGWQFFERLNQRIPDHQIKCYILTSSISHDDETRAASYPALNGYLCKPLTLEKIQHGFSG